MGLGGEDDDAKDTSSMKIPRGLSEKLDAWTKKTGMTKIDHLRHLEQILPDDPDDLMKMVGKVGQVQGIDQGPSPTGGAAQEMKEIALMKMWKEVASDGGGKRDDSMSMKEMIMMKMIFSPPPEKPSMFEQMMMYKEMKGMDGGDKTGFQEFVRLRDEEHKRDLEAREKAFERQLAEINGKLDAKQQREDLEEIRNEGALNFERFTQVVTEQFRAEADRIASRLGSADGPKSKAQAAKDAFKELKDMMEAIREIAPDYGLTPQQTSAAVQEAANKTDLSKHVDNIKDLITATTGMIDKIQQVGAPASVPPPADRFVESAEGLRPVKMDIDTLQFSPPERKVPLPSVSPDAA